MTNEFFARFIATVKAMRLNQREYFRTRNGMSLQMAKSAEREVDKMLQDIEDEGKPKQGVLL